MNGSVKRIAMWSGPRNISTALMRAWENRIDTVVCDEPLYGYYLRVTGLDHPGADEVIAHQPTDWGRVVEELLGPLPDGKTIFYQKHMAHHLLPEIGRDWLDQLTHCFLIRDPREVLISYVARRARPTLEDLGFPQQIEIFKRVCDVTGAPPPVIDARDVLEDPPGMLARLCEALGVPFSERMLSWPAGRRASDGIWAKHWYDQVESSTTFRPYTPKADPLPAALEDIHQACRVYYMTLYDHRLTAPPLEDSDAADL